jgi:hypothetical protein
MLLLLEDDHHLIYQYAPLVSHIKKYLPCDLDLGFIHTLREENVNVVGCKNLIERVM